MPTPKITLYHRPLNTVPKKFVQIILTEETVGKHQVVESTNGNLTAKIGAGKWADLNLRTFRTLIRNIVQIAKGHQLENIVIDTTSFAFPVLAKQTDDWLVSTIVENILLASYDFTKYKSPTKTNKTALKEVLLITNKSAASTAGFKRGLIVGKMVNEARDVANTSGDDLTPKELATVAKKMARGTKVSVKAYDRTEIKKMKLGLLEAVGKGSHNEPYFIVMEYYGAGKNTGKKIDSTKKPLVLIGKGITYDTGGLNIKPNGAGMHEMHLDMSGGSSVMASIVAAAKLGLKKNIVALIPAAENAVSGTSMRAGDIVTSLSGQTVEVLHTDAEGRLVLADALTYSERFNPKAIVDVATLTGASLVALGQHASAVMCQNEKLENFLREQGETSGDLVWPLPLWEEYKPYLKSHRADLSNISTSFSRFGGVIEGGTFLSFFAPKNIPWAHLDIAPRMESIPSDKLTKGSTGEPVRLLINFLEKY